MKKYLDTDISLKNIDFALLILRVIGGGFMLTHGVGKLMKLINGDFGFPDPLGIGMELSLGLTVFSEFLCAALILIGLGTRLASIPLAITMLVAGFIHHGGDSFNKKEMALLYFGIYLILFFLGSGKYSVDSLFKKK